MGFNDFLKSAGDKLKQAADATAKFAAEKAEEAKHNAKLMEYKRSIINSLSLGQIQSLSKHFAAEPRPPEDISFFEDKPKKKKKFVPGREDYIDALMRGPTCQDIIDWCRKNRIGPIEGFASGRTAYMKKNRIDDAGKKLPEEATFQEAVAAAPQQANASVQEPPKDLFPEKAKPIVKVLEELAVPINFKDEGKAQYWLYGQLCGLFPGRVEVEPDRKTADISIDGDIVIEVKNFGNGGGSSGEIDRLIGQISEHSHKYTAYIVVIFGGAEDHRQKLLRVVGKLPNVAVIVK